MRIIGGIYRGKKLLSPRSANIRPTSDQAREAIFNILYSKVDRSWNELKLADIFTGSGAFALEAISRGVRLAVLVDLDLADAARNINLFPNETAKIKTIRADAAKLPTINEKFDIVFLDAPYHKNLSDKALHSLLERNWLADNAICVVELARDEKISVPANLKIIDERNYGITRFLFLQKETA